MESKETFNVAPWNDERVKRCHGVAVAYRISEGIGADRCRYDFAEAASLLSVVVVFSDFSKISLIPPGRPALHFEQRA